MDPYLIIFNVGFFPPQVINVVGSPQSHTHRHAHQRHYKKTRRLRSMQQVCTTQVGPIVFFFVFKKLRNKCLIRFEKKTTHDETHFIKPTEEEEKKKDFFHII